jgi:hypothetical protein
LKQVIKKQVKGKKEKETEMQEFEVDEDGAI